MQRSMGRAPCCSGDHEGLKKGPWTREEDEKLKSFLLLNPNTSWRLVPPKAGLLRCGKSCRLRWMNYLRPDIKRGNFTPEEENLIIQLHSAVGNRWSAIASQLPGRTDNEIKNLWNTKLKKLLVLKGINPITHQPLCDPLLSDYVKQWVKSIEDVIIAGIMTQSSSSNINNFSTIDAPVDAYLPSLRSLPPQPQFSIEYHKTQPHIPNPNPTSHDYIYPTNMDSGFWVDETFQNSGRSLIDDLILDEGSSLPGSLSDQFLGDVWEEKTDSPVMEMASSGANLTLEEGFQYWN